jgi:WD40 repeat protein
MLLAAYADGHVVQWRVGVDGDSGSVVRSLSTGASNSVYALAWQSDAKHFVAAGRDHVVRLYDANTGQLVRAFDNTGRHGHTNRIYALQWHPRDAHTLLSGGWDNTVQMSVDPFASNSSYRARVGIGIVLRLPKLILVRSVLCSPCDVRDVRSDPAGTIAQARRIAPSSVPISAATRCR